MGGSENLSGSLDLSPGTHLHASYESEVVTATQILTSHSSTLVAATCVQRRMK